MAAFLKPTRLPTLLAALAMLLAAAYALVFRPLRQYAAELDKPLVYAWNSLALTNKTADACEGLDATNAAARLQTIRTALTNLESAQRLLEARLALAPEVLTRLNEPFQLIDFQNERQLQANLLARTAKEAKIALEPAATNGLPQYTADLEDPRLLWARLHVAQQLLLTAIHARVAGLRSLTQLPPRPAPADAPARSFAELPMQLEVFGPTDALSRLLNSLPLRGPELDVTGLAAALTNKPVLFVDRLLLRKHSPERPEDALLEIVVVGSAPLPPALTGVATTP
ncbi:MAG TPA: hypothetical protein PKM73_16035 [Verrucomicrobiota bacterium]|nr:hypothetical protein [Verrucomicrobiota bacterium]HNU52859.1 hypothetical protein [Verrucomicrobiota bacterium]